MKNSIIVELAIHKKVMDEFLMQPLSSNQTITKSIRPQYDIVTLEIFDYMDIIPTVQQFLPFIKVLIPLELDLKIREHMQDYDTHDL